jgi:glutathione S-transferase
MQLWYAATSPFARKVRITTHELGLADRIEAIEVNPWTDTRLRALNPLAKVPTLVLDDGSVLYESALICDYCDSLVPGRRLFPADGQERWQALKLHALADGACTLVGRLYADERRPETDRSETMMARFRDARDATLSALEAEPPAPGLDSIGAIAAAALLGYLDFRWPDRDWRRARPRLTTWFAGVADRPSMRATPHPTA